MSFTLGILRNGIRTVLKAPVRGLGVQSEVPQTVE